VSTRKIRVTAELYIAGHHIPPEYEDLPEGWDDWPEDKQDKYLTTLATEMLAEYAGCGADVIEVDENGKEIEPS
jgi:hypothetical protein